MTLRIRLVRWFLANALLAGISFLCAGSVKHADVEAISRRFCAVGFISILTDQAGSGERTKRSQASEGTDPAVRHGCEHLVRCDSRFRRPRCGKASLDIPIFQRSADGGIRRFYCGQCSSNLGDGCEYLLFDGASPSGGAGPRSGNDGPYRLRSTSGLSRDVAHCAFDSPSHSARSSHFSRHHCTGHSFCSGPGAKTGSSSKISLVMPIISQGAPLPLNSGSLVKEEKRSWNARFASQQIW